MAAVLENDLFSWLKLFWPHEESVSYESLADGYFLNEVFKEIDPNAQNNEQLGQSDCLMDRVKNWEILAKNIRIYYTTVLQQTILVRLPSTITICHDALSYKSQAEIDKAIFLILGAAVQCERKEYFIQDIINRLTDESIQHGLMGYIKQVTEETETVISYLGLDDLPKSDLIKKLRHLTEEWEESFLEDTKSAIFKINELMIKVKDQQNQIQVLKNVGIDNGLITLAVTSEKSASLELAECKAKIRKLQNEIDDKSDIIHDLKEDLERLQDENTKLKECQMKLTNQTRRVRVLQDELDSVRESISRLPGLESENAKLKEKVNDLEYYKTRCEELRDDLTVMANENSNLSELIENGKRDSEKLLSLESEYKKLTRRVQELEQNASLNLEENNNLQRQLNELNEKDSMHLVNKTQLEKELKRLQKSTSEDKNSSSISDQVIERTNAKLLRTEMENRNLQEKMSHMKTEEIRELSALRDQLSDLKEENERLCSKIAKAQESNKRDLQQMLDEKETKQMVLREKQQLELKIETLKENECRRVQELVKENENLTETLLSIRERSEKSNDARVIELEKENAKLHLSMTEINHKHSQLEFDLQRKVQNCIRLDTSLEKAQQEHLRLSKENADLNKEIANLKMFKSRYEELQVTFSNLEVEKLRLEALVNEYHMQLQHSTTVNSNKVEEEVKCLAVENQRKTSQLLTKIRELESELLTVKSESEKHLRLYNSSENKVKGLNQELENLKSECSNFHGIEGKLKLSEKNLQALENEREQLQGSNLKLEQERKKIEMEHRRLKNQLEIQNQTIEKYLRKISDLENKLHVFEVKEEEKVDIETLQNNLADTEKRLIDSEQKNRELYEDAKKEKKQCSNLREELIKERLKTQDLQNQLQKLTDELEKFGISEEDAKAEKFEMLESKINTTITETIKKKDEKISSLEIKLSASVNRNKELADKMDSLNAKFQSLQQKYEEELAVNDLKSSKSHSTKDSVSPFAQHLIQLKDDIIKLERKNAELDSEKRHATTICEEVKEKLKSTETKYSEQLQNLEKNYNQSKSDNVKLTIEISALRSQFEVLKTENKSVYEHLSQSEKSLNTASNDASTLMKSKENLESQLNHLQKINNHLSQDYEIIKNELSSQKAKNKSLQSDLLKTRNELDGLKKNAESVKHLKEILENEKSSLASGAQQLLTLREDNENLSKENSELLREKSLFHEKLRALSQENKIVKYERNKEKSFIVHQNDKIERLEKEKKELEIEIAKLEEKIDSLSNEKEYLLEENKKLLLQMKQMLMQNQELLTETLQNRESHFTEECALRERLNNLQRQKERLEEKIMEQYKTIPSTKKPKGGRLKFLRKAKEALKRRESKTSGSDDRKNSSENLTMGQRSKSCLTILSTETEPKFRANDKRNSIDVKDGKEMSYRDIFASDDERSDWDYSSMISRMKSLKQSDFETNSLLSSVSQRVHDSSSQPHPKLMPGSMSMYDRDENEKQQVSVLNQYLLELHNKKMDEEKLRSIPNSTDDGKHMRNSINLTKSSPRPQSAIDSSLSFRRILPQQPKLITKDKTVPSDSLVFGKISSKDTSSQQNPSATDSTVSSPVTPTAATFQNNRPVLPIRKASLPVTDRAEEELSQPDLCHDHQINRSYDSSRKMSTPVVVPRSQSTVPSSASSRAILQRMQKTAQRNSSQTLENRTKPRPPTPSSEIVKSADSNNSSQFKPRQQNIPSSSYNTYSHRNGPPTPIRVESSRQRPSSKQSEPLPQPPIRKESGKGLLNHETSSSKSDISDHVECKSKVFYQYGNV